MSAHGLTSLRSARLPDRLARMLSRRRLRNGLTLALVVAAPILAIFTLVVLGKVGVTGGSRLLSLALVLDFVYLLLLLGLVLMRIAQMVASRRRARAGSRLHSRLVGIFALRGKTVYERL